MPSSDTRGRIGYPIHKLMIYSYIPIREICQLNIVNDRTLITNKKWALSSIQKFLHAILKKALVLIEICARIMETLVVVPHDKYQMMLALH